MKTPVNVAITGAAGQIGYALAFRVASGQMLGADQPVNLHLLEITPTLRRTAGRGDGTERLRVPDAEQGRGDRRRERSPSGTARWRCSSARARAAPAWSARTCCSPTRRSSPRRARRSNAVADRNVRVLVVGNPGEHQRADRARERAGPQSAQLHRDDAARSQPRAVAARREDRHARHRHPQKLTIWGNHSSTQYPDLHRTRRSSGKPAQSLVDQKWIEEHVHPGRAAARRGDHQGARRVVRGLGRIGGDRPRARLGQGHRRTATGSAWPCRRTAATASRTASSIRIPGHCENGEYAIVQGLAVDEFSRARMDTTYKELLEERDGVKDLI